MRKGATLYLLAMLMLGAQASLLSPGAHAATLGMTINTAIDAPDATLGDGVCATSLGLCSLRAAVQEINVRAQQGNNITIPTGVYLLSIKGSREDWGATGDLDLRVNVYIMGSPGTVIQAVPGFGDRLFDIPAGTNPNVTFNQMTLQGGLAPTDESGGGIRERGTGLLYITNVTVTGNAAGKSGGGLYQDAGSLRLTYSTFSANKAMANGGGIDFEGAAYATEFHHMTITGNKAFRGGGLGAFVSPGGTGSIPLLDLTTFDLNMTSPGGFGGGVAIARTWLVHATITGNTAAYGGGVELVPSSVPAILAGLVRVNGNHATRSGGGIYGACTPTCGTLLHVTLEANVAAQNGSAIYLNGGLSMEKVTVDANSTEGGGKYGGAIYHTGPAGAPLTMTNVTIGQNTNGPLAGALAVNSGSVDILRDVTIANNNGGSANGVAVTTTSAVPQVLNSIVSSTGLNCNRSLTSLGYNIDSSNGCGFNQTGDMRNTDPMLYPLSDNGGNTWTMKPSPVSPIVDAGDPFTCPVTDQRSVIRPVDGDGDGTPRCDMGAEETGVTALNSDIGITSATALVSGSTVTYTINLKSAGEWAGLETRFTDLLPPELGFESCDVTLGGVCDRTGNAITVTFDTIEVGDTPEITLVADIQGSGTISNSMSVWSMNPDWFPIDNVATVNIQV